MSDGSTKARRLLEFAYFAISATFPVASPRILFFMSAGFMFCPDEAGGNSLAYEDINTFESIQIIPAIKPATRGAANDVPSMVVSAL
jgi:hypothetical protein